MGNSYPPSLLLARYQAVVWGGKNALVSRNINFTQRTGMPRPLHAAVGMH